MKLALAFLCAILSQGIDSCTAAARRTDTDQLDINTSAGPNNNAVVAPQTPNVSLLCCATDTTISSSRIQWWEYGTRASGNLISDHNTLLPAHPNYGRYELRTTGQCFELVIYPVNLGDGTKYECFDLYADPPGAARRGAQLVVIKENPLTSSLVGPNDAVEGTYYTMTCSLEFGATHPVSPLITWTGPSPFAVEDIITNSTVWSGLSFYAHRSMDGRTFSCKANFTSRGLGGLNMASNVPTWTWTYTFPALRVKWAPTNMTISPPGPPYDLGTTLTCWVDANPAANYTWIAAEGPVAGKVWPSQNIVLTDDMGGPNVLICHAENFINNIKYVQDTSYEIDIEYFNACASDPCINGGVCIRNGNGFYCQCIPGFTGSRCEILVDNCASQPCLNGGTCFNNVDSYRCICRPEYTGLNCESPL